MKDEILDDLFMFRCAVIRLEMAEKKCSEASVALFEKMTEEAAKQIQELRQNQPENQN